MSSPVFRIKEHTVECQHIREYARATAESQEAILYLAVKQYIPLDNLSPQDGDVTIIGAHANGFPKELYEPLWEDLHARSKSSGFKIRSIWIADLAQEGASSVLNEDLLGNDPSWMDHVRDLLHLVNTFRAEMPMPIVGIGHSLGGNMLINLSLMHPRLLSTVVLLDPVVSQHASSPIAGSNVAQMSTFRRDLWPSRAEAEASFRKSKFYSSWDPRVLDRWCKYGIRETPTKLYPDEHGSITLTTTKHHECFTFLRPTWLAMSEGGVEVTDRDMIPDMGHDSLVRYPFYRPEPPNTLARLGEVRPSVLYIFGGTSDMSFPEARKQKIAATGIGTGGSGGEKLGRVKEKVLEGIGHLVAMEASDQCAEAAADWLGQELARFEEEKKKYLEWTKKDFISKTTLSEEWKRRIGGPIRPPKGKL